MIDCLVIPAAGLGTRMRSVSRTVPKELLPIGNRPAIQYALFEALDAGIREVIVVIRPGKETVRRTVEKLTQPYRDVLRVSWVNQPVQRGEADAIIQCRSLILGRPFAVIYPDNIYHAHPGMLRHLIRAFERRPGHVLALSPVDHELAGATANSGRVDVKPLADGLYRITGFHPKGPGPFTLRFPGELRSCGVYLTSPDFFWAAETVARQGVEGEHTDGKVRRVLLDQGKTFVGCPLPEPVYDVGVPEGYRLCWRRMVGREAPT